MDIETHPVGVPRSKARFLVETKNRYDASHRSRTLPSQAETNAGE
jgi:hypothetical protein